MMLMLGFFPNYIAGPPLVLHVPRIHHEHRLGVLRCHLQLAGGAGSRRIELEKPHAAYSPHKRNHLAIPVEIPRTIRVSPGFLS
jgi:hypothetical protein